MKKELHERELDDDYPVRAGYLYVVDGTVIQATQEGNVAMISMAASCGI
jgi:hypothetical protein